MTPTEVRACPNCAIKIVNSVFLALNYGTVTTSLKTLRDMRFGIRSAAKKDSLNLSNGYIYAPLFQNTGFVLNLQDFPGKV